MSVVIVRGTNGAGKTYLVRQLIEQLGEPIRKLAIGPDEKPGGYVWRGVTILGRYETACGGCDCFSWKGAADDIEALIDDEASREQHVILEGIIVSTWGVPRLKRLHQKHDLYLIQLDTTLEECIASVEQRRRERGNTKPLNPKNLTSKHEGLKKGVAKLKGMGLNVEELGRPDALARVRTLVGLPTPAEAAG